MSNIDIKYQNPLKIIHKFKNNNRRIQYIQYIFIGSFISDEVNDILESIKTKNFFDTINTLSKNKINILELAYGQFWYQSFFNRYHMIDQFNSILKNSNKRHIIETKMGTEWFVKHVEIIPIKKTEYSFASNYHDYLIARNKIVSNKLNVQKAEMDFRTYNVSVNNITQVGGDDEEIEDDNDNNDIKIKDDDDDEPAEQTLDDIDDDIVEEFNLDELTKLYSMDVIENDKNIKETSKLISEATRDNSYVKTSNNTEISFNETIDEIGYDSRLEEIYDKYYIRDQFIFMDDNIKTIRQKITVSIPISDKFGEDIKLLPEYQYFWTEYNLKNTKLRTCDIFDGTNVCRPILVSNNGTNM
jgi:hypothetical protein